MILQYFDQIDVDRSGQLGRAEITAFMEKVRQLVWPPVEEKFKAAGADSSGSLTPEEAAAMPMLAKHFEFVDANDDHVVDLAEIRNSLDPATMRAHVIVRLEAADAGKDGRVSLAEAQASLPRAYAHFEQLDASQDGYLTIEDFQQLSMVPG
jgi:Ca2+-binding EF-hand superfamily protein